MESSNDPMQFDATWQQLSLVLDEAMARLRDQDRDAVVLRFFEGRNLRDVGAALGLSEDAAKKRVARALEKLRKSLARRGVDSTAAAIGETIAANSIQAAPFVLSKSITAMAATKGATASASTTTLIKGALKIMAWSQTKTAIIAAAVVIMAAGTSLVVVRQASLIRGKTESEWINSIVYFGDDNQMRLWHSLGPKGIQMLVHALKPPPNELTQEQAHLSRVNRMKAASVLCQLEDNNLGNDAQSALPEIINDIKAEKDDGVLGIELGMFEMPIQSMSETEKAALFPELLRDIQHNNSSVRNNALVALQYYPDQADAVIPLMVKSLQDPIPGVRLMAVQALIKIDPQNAASSSFVKIVAGCITGPQGDMPGALNEAVIMLGQLHREPDVAVPVLIQSLQNPDAYVRGNAAAALGRFGGQARSAVPALTRSLEDSDHGIRRQAAAALKRINSSALAQ